MHIKSTASALALALISTTALAADLPSRRAPPVYAPPPIPVFTWTGFYAGGQLGGEFGRSNTVSTVAATGTVLDVRGVSKNGFIGGGHVGYLFSTQSLPVLGGVFGANGGFGIGTGGVIGIEGDVDGTSAKANVFLPVAGVTNTARESIQGSVRGRLGVTFDRALFYATGGAAFGSLHNNYFNPATGGFDSLTHTRVGYTVGGGVEYAFTNNFSVRVEYRVTDFGRFTDNLANSTGGVVNVTHRETDNRVQAGFSYHFNTPVAPVVARY